MAIKLTEIAPQVWEVDSGIPGPVATVLGGVHGSEKAGVEVVKNLLAADLSKIVQQGKLNLGIGNPVAVEKGVRSLEGDYDLNRSFGPMKPEIAQTIAGARAELLKPIIAASDVLLDLHATIKPSDPMVLSPNDLQKEALLKKLVPILGIKTVITGKGLYNEDGTGVTTDCYAHSNGKIGVTLETGWQEDMTLVPRIQKAVLKALEIIGISPVSDEDVEPMDIQHFDAYWSVTATSFFEFVQQWGNFAKLQAGTHFANRDGVKLKTPCDSFMIFQKPKDRIIPGTEACLLLRDPRVARGMTFWDIVQQNQGYPRVPEWIRMMDEALEGVGGRAAIGVTNAMVSDAFSQVKGEGCEP